MIGALRIGVDVREWEPGTSTGIARFLTGFLSWATERSPHSVHVFGNHRTEIRVTGPLIHVHRAPEKRRIVWDQVTLPRMLREQSIDVFLSPYYKAPLFAPCPVVVTLHDLVPLRFPDYAAAEGASRSSLRRRWMKLLVGGAERVVTDSEHARADVVATLGIPEARVEVVPVPLSPVLSRPPDPEHVDRAQERLGLPRDYLLYVGRHDPHKNVETLVRAFHALEEPLRARHPLVLAGRGAETSARDTHHVIAPGFVSDEDLPGLYGGARAFAFPSRYEGFGLPPLEAMGCGIPVVAADATALPEVVGDAGLLVDPEDVGAWTEALRRVLTDESLRSRLIAAGRSRATLYAPELVAAQLLAVVESVAIAARRPRSTEHNA